LGRTIPEVEPSISGAVSELALLPGTAMAESRCILCDAALEMGVAGLSDTRFGVPGSYEIHRCTRCGLEQTVPRPSISELKALYQTYYNFGGETGTLYTRLREHFFFSVLNRLWSVLDGDVSFYQRRGTGRLIDIGCNEGRGLRIYARNGFQVEGLELNETAAAVARKSGFIVQTCLLSDFVPTQPYKVAVLSNVLEHSLDPRQMLQDVHRILAGGGQVWISCPNSESWFRRVFGRSWISWHVPFHIVHFSAATLRRALEDAGYAQIEIRQITPAVWFAQSLIAYLFATKGKKNRQLRNPFLTLFIMLLARFVLFPVLWLANKCGRGDCLLTVATKA
jgi:2-polyprenyl-3-methyl-5-hydroxy-6-metoxy-1,4-benzoquinol methylase